MTVSARTFKALNERAEAIDKALTKLAKRKDIVAYLHRRGIRGVPGEPCKCPVAEFLFQETGIRKVSVDSTEVVIWAGKEKPDHFGVVIALHNHPEARVISLPHEVEQFISDFDRGRYPSLMTKGPW